MVIDPNDLGATKVFAPGLMLDNFLPIPDAESLPFYALVLKLVVCSLAGVTAATEGGDEGEEDHLPPVHRVVHGAACARVRARV